MEQRTCIREGCGRVEQLRCGLCQKHYRQVRTTKRGACKWNGCEIPWETAGFCWKHYKYVRSFGLPGETSATPLRGACSVIGCPEPVKARGWCENHYWHWRTYGHPLAGSVPSPPPIMRKHSLDEAFFDAITTERQAYWLGFLAADGNIQHVNHRYVLQIQLAATDRDHLAMLGQDLGSSVPVRGDSRHIAYLTINSRHLVESLIRLGITPRKSAIIEPWVGPAHLMHHYWRGLFDGDGSIGKYRDPVSWSVSQVGSKACVDAFANWAVSVCGSQATPRHRSGGCWEWAVSGSKMPQRLAAALYAGATVSLARKRSLADELLAWDVDAHRAQGNLRRATAMRARWADEDNPWKGLRLFA